MRYWTKVTIGLLVTAIGVLAARENGWSLPTRAEGETRSNGSNWVEVVSKPYTLDKIYLSMTGRAGTIL